MSSGPEPVRRRWWSGPRPWLGLALVVLAVWLFRPGEERQKPVALWSGSATGAFTLRAGGVEQVVDGATVRRSGVELPTDPDRVQALWAALGAVRALPERTLSADATAAAAHGCGPGAELTAPGVWLRWSQTRDADVLWDGHQGRVAVLPPRSPAVDAIVSAAGRLDRREPLAGIANRVGLVQIDERFYVRGPGGWHEPARPLRSALDVRIGAVLDLLASVSVDSLVHVPATATAALIRVDVGGRPVPVLLEHVPGSGGRVRIGDLPPQPLAPVSWRAWRAVLAATRDDALADPFDALAVQRIETPAAVLERRANRGNEGEWEVLWEGGRERADPGAAERLLGAISAVRLDRLRPGPVPASRGILAVATRDQRWAWQVGDGVIGDERRHGVPVIWPGWLDQPPESWFDPRPFTGDPSRVIAVQRIHAGGAEVLRRGDDGRWRRTWPATAAVSVDRAAVESWLARFAALTGDRSGKPGAAERRAADAAPVAFAVRLAPVEPERPGSDDHDLADAVGGDRGWAAWPDGDGWRMVDRDGRLARTVSGSALADLLHPFPSAGIAAVLPGEVQAITVSAETAWTIRREGDGWATDAGRRVEPWQVARLLRVLGEPPRGGEMLPVERTGAVRITTDTRSVVVEVGRADPAGRIPVAVDGRGVGWIDAAAAADLLPAEPRG